MKKLFISLSILISLISITGCFNTIFYDILTDVPPESATVSGNISSIARYNIDGTEFLFLGADKGLRYKKADSETHEEWKVFSDLPFILHKYVYYASEGDHIGHNGQQILKVLTDSDTIYLVTVSYTTDDDDGITCPEQFYIWAAKFTLDENSNVTLSGEWKDVAAAKNVSADESIRNKLLGFAQNEKNVFFNTSFNVFGTNSPKPEHRKVFIRSMTKTSDDPKDNTRILTYYSLSGLNEPEEFTPANVIDNPNGNLNSAAYIGESIYFFESDAVATNETFTSNASYAYFGAGNTLYYTNGSKNTDGTFDKTTSISNAGEPISCLAVCSDFILIGRAKDGTTYTSNGGIVQTSLTNGIPGTSLESFTTNINSQINSNYFIFTLFNTDPAKKELESCLYAAIGFIGTGSNQAVSYGNIGLWSYYPERGNWNRE